MLLEREELLKRFYARPSGDDGRYLVGVLSTGIYCLPSCRARKPRPENVRFFPGEDEARRSGLRACKRCRPDHFYRRFDPELELARSLAERVRSAPADFAAGAALADAAGVGATKLAALFRQHFHASPAALLTRARVEHAARALRAGRTSVLDAALEAGFDSASSFHANFRRAFGLTPRAWRALGTRSEFELSLPRGYRADEARALFARGGAAGPERADGARLRKALVLDGRALGLEIELASAHARVRVHGLARPASGPLLAAHRAALRLLGLACDPARFEGGAATPEQRERRTRLIGARAGLRIPLTADAFEGLVWVIAGQQMSVRFASDCRARLVERCGARVGDLFAHPGAEAVAALEQRDLTALRFSRRKAEYLLDAARAIASGALPLEELGAEPAPAVAARLAEVRGLGPWSIQYLLMRSYGFADCVPVGDAGLLAALQRFFGLPERPDTQATLELMQEFAPHRSLATYHFWHLWKSLGDPA